MLDEALFMFGQNMLRKKAKEILEKGKKENSDHYALKYFMDAYDRARQLKSVTLQKEILDICYKRLVAIISEILAKFETGAELNDDHYYRNYRYRQITEFLEFCERSVNEMGDGDLKEKIARVRANMDVWIQAGQTPGVELKRAHKKFNKAIEKDSEVCEASSLFKEANVLATKLDNTNLRNEIAQASYDKAYSEFKKSIEEQKTSLFSDCDALFALSSETKLPVRKQSDHEILLKKAASLCIQELSKQFVGNNNAISFCMRASIYAKQASDTALQQQIAKVCTERANSAVNTIGFFKSNTVTEFLHIASEIAKDISDLALQKKIAQICLLCAGYNYFRNESVVDLYTMAAVNDPEQHDPCLTGILTGNLIEVDFNIEANQRILWLTAGISLVVDPEGRKASSYSSRILEKRQEIENFLPTIQKEIGMVLSCKDVVLLLISYVGSSMDIAKDCAPARLPYH